MKRWIAGILCVSCLLMMTACSRNGEEVSGSQEESSQVMESSSESVEQPSEDSQPEEPVSSQPRTVSIRPVTSAEAEPVQVNVTARNAIAAEMAVVSDGQKAAEFAAELQSVIPSDQAIPSDAQPVEILLVYSMDGGEHRYQLYRESDVDYIAKDGVLYQGGAGLSTWADAVIPALPAVPEGADAAQTSGTEQIVLKKSSLYRASERVVWDTVLQEQIRGWIADARPLEGEFTPDTGGETIEVSFGEGDSYIFSSQTQDGAGLMKHDSAWYLVEKEAFSTLSGIFS